MTELEEATRTFWIAGTLFRRGIGPDLTTSKCISICNDASDSLGPHRRVKYKLHSLRDIIIAGRSRKKANRAPTQNVLPLVRQSS